VTLRGRIPGEVFLIEIRRLSDFGVVFAAQVHFYYYLKKILNTC